jgi:hypothetical protein
MSRCQNMSEQCTMCIRLQQLQRCKLVIKRTWRREEAHVIRLHERVVLICSRGIKSCRTRVDSLETFAQPPHSKMFVSSSFLCSTSPRIAHAKMASVRLCVCCKALFVASGTLLALPCNKDSPSSSLQIHATEVRPRIRFGYVRHAAVDAKGRKNE